MSNSPSAAPQQSQPQNTSSEQDKDQDKATEEAYDIAWAFVSEYYKFLSTEHTQIHRFYSKNSTFLHGTELDGNSTVHFGQAQINEQILAMDPQGCKIKINTIDMQPSMGDGVVLQVIGGLCGREEDFYKKFVQTFFLAKQVGGYYVRNDIFRYLVNSDENDDPAQHDHQPKNENSPAAESEPVDELANGFSKVSASAEKANESAPSASTKLSEPAVGVEQTKVSHEDNDKSATVPPTDVASESSEKQGAEAESATTPKPTAAVQARSPAVMTWAALAKSNSTQQVKASAPTSAPTVKTSNTPPVQAVPVAQPQRKDYKIFVKGITPALNAEELRKALTVYGKLKEFDCVHQKACAFIEYESPRSAEEAIAASSATKLMIDGHHIILEFRKEKSASSAQPNQKGAYNKPRKAGQTLNQQVGGKATQPATKKN